MNQELLIPGVVVVPSRVDVGPRLDNVMLDVSFLAVFSVEMGHSV